METQLPDRALGQHGMNTYYKEFTVIISETDVKTYELGHFYSVRKSKDNDEVVIAEFQLIWHSSKDNKSYASAKLYFNPQCEEDAPENIVYGKDEVIAADRQVVIECIKVPEWECSSNDWYKDVGCIVYKDCPEWVSNIYRTENSSKVNSDVMKIKILSFAQYCRYMTCLKMIKMGVVMSFKTLIARGGLTLTALNTLIVFQRNTFKRYNIEELSPTGGIRVPAFSGRPRKRKKAASTKYPVPKKSKSDLIDINKSGSNPPKRNAALMATCALADAADIMESKLIEYNVPVTRAVTSCDSTTLQMKLQNASDKKEINYKKTKSDSDQETVKETKPETRSNDNDEGSKFNNILNDFMCNRGSPILKVPTVGYSKLNLHQLFNVVATYGGYGQVTLKKQWKYVYEGLGGKHYAGITNAATCTRKAYEKLLLPYEKHMRIKSKSKKEKEAKAVTKEESNNNNNNRKKQEETKSFTVENSDGCKLLIQKRRGRPSKEFRQQIEKLKSSNQKVKVEIYPPLSKTSKVPAWMNELNADIVNPHKRKKQSEGDCGRKRENIVILSNKPKVTSSSSPTKKHDVLPPSRDLIPIRKPDIVIAPKSINHMPNNSMKSNAFYTSSNSATSDHHNISITNRPRLISADKIMKDVPKLMDMKDAEDSYNLPPTSQQTHYIYYPVNTSANVISTQPVHSIMPYDIVHKPSIYVKSTKGPKIKNTPIVASHYPRNYYTVQGYNGTNEYVSSRPARKISPIRSHQMIAKRSGIAEHSRYEQQHTGHKYILPTSHVANAPELIPAELIPIDHVRIAQSANRERIVSPSSSRERIVSPPSNGNGILHDDERYRIYEDVIPRSHNNGPSYKHNRPITVYERERNNTNHATSPRYDKQRYTVYEERDDRVISYISKRDIPEKYIIHKPRVIEREKEKLYPIVYTHVPRQYVSNLKHDPRDNIVIDEQQRHTRLVYPNTLVSIEHPPEQRTNSRHIDIRDRSYERYQTVSSIGDQ